MRSRVRSKLAFGAAVASLMATWPANGDVYIDPNDYNCSEELKISDLGFFQARVFANKKSGVRSLEGEWRSNSRTPSIRGFFRGRDFGVGNFNVTYTGIVSEHRVRVQIGNCYGNQNVCGRGTDYATDFRHTDGNLYAPANWGAVVSIGKERGNLYLQVQDETGIALREDKLPVATLLAAEREMNRLMDTVTEKEALLKDQC